MNNKKELTAEEINKITAIIGDMDEEDFLNSFALLAQKNGIDEPDELCSNCGLPIHPCLPCGEMIAFCNHTDSEYFRLLQLILDEGRKKKNRTGVDTIGVFGEQAKFEVNMDAFPILTTKRVWFKGIVHELLWFIKGDTNIKYLVDNDVHIWDEWAFKRYHDANKINDVFEDDKWFRYFDKDGKRVAKKEDAHTLSMYPQDEFIEKIKTDKEFADRWGDLGEGTYGGMWRAFPYYDENPEWEYGGIKGTEAFLGTIDQLRKVIDKLKTNPDDRRMIVSAWHPYWVDHCALPPCHCLFHFNTEELTAEERLELSDGKVNGSGMSNEEAWAYYDKTNVPRRKLNCLMLIRSNDMFLGAPFNITSYSLLTAMVAHCVGMAPGTLTYTIGDAHIYCNHLEQVKEQLSREPKLLPKLWINPKVRDLFSLKYEDIHLINYVSHPAIKGDVAV